MTSFTEDQVRRYARHIILPGIGGDGQRMLLDSKVLVIGAGGLGSPVAMLIANVAIGQPAIVTIVAVTGPVVSRPISPR